VPNCWLRRLSWRRDGCRPLAGVTKTSDDRVRWGRELDVAVVTDKRRRPATGSRLSGQVLDQVDRGDRVLDIGCERVGPTPSTCQPICGTSSRAPGALVTKMGAENYVSEPGPTPPDTEVTV